MLYSLKLITSIKCYLILLKIKQNKTMQINITINIGILVHMYKVVEGGRKRSIVFSTQTASVTLTDPICELLYRDNK